MAILGEEEILSIKTETAYLPSTFESPIPGFKSRWAEPLFRWVVFNYFALTLLLLEDSCCDPIQFVIAIVFGLLWYLFMKYQ